MLRETHAMWSKIRSKLPYLLRGKSLEEAADGLHVGLEESLARRVLHLDGDLLAGVQLGSVDLPDARTAQRDLRRNKSGAQDGGMTAGREGGVCETEED